MSRYVHQVQSLQEHLLRAALGYITSDIPATRKICGFYGIRAKKGCSKCLKSFVPFSDHDVFGSNLNYSGYNRYSWEPRIHSVHCQQVCLAKSAATKCGKEAIEHDIGARYSELLRDYLTLTISRSRIFIARKSPGHAFLASFNRNTARKRYPYCQGYNGFWSAVHPVEYVQIRHERHSVVYSYRTTVVHERGSLAIIDRFPPGPAFTWS